MIRHAYFALVISFWVFMNVLLWRAEMSNKQADTGSPVPINLVWTRILTAPDDSPLDVFKNGQKLGHCRWWANIIETQKPPGLTESAGTNHIEGRVEHVAGYTLDLEGNVLIGPSQPRLRFTWHAEFDHKQSWRSFTIRLNTRQTSVEVRANADTQTLSFLTHDGQSSWQRTL
ncbi:MAG: hypothetical protein N3G20_05875, partial [Verrucomicrobiae bacterium]|nr:hypothetical protein [Verrucomicrobiae bacterium]